MKSFKRVFTLSFAALLIPLSSMACEDNFDCRLGSKCQIAQGAMAGVCVGGMQPGNSNDKKPVRFMHDITGKLGNTCSFDADCGYKNECVKDRHAMEGVCLPESEPTPSQGMSLRELLGED